MAETYLNSFSKTFFTTKFKLEKRKDTYHNFDLDSIKQLPALFKDDPKLKGVNVTIPYKEEVIPILDRIDKEAKKIWSRKHCEEAKGRKTGRI